MQRVEDEGGPVRARLIKAGWGLLQGHGMS